MIALNLYGVRNVNTDRLQIKTSSNPKVAVTWATLDIPDTVRQWCRESGIVIGMDAYMRYQFKGRRSVIEKLITDHLAPHDEQKRREFMSSVIEA